VPRRKQLFIKVITAPVLHCIVKRLIPGGHVADCRRRNYNNDAYDIFMQEKRVRIRLNERPTPITTIEKNHVLI
jgi:hypothetical protein